MTTDYADRVERIMTDPYDGIPPVGAIEQSPALTFTTFTDLAAKVDAAGPRKWLLRGVWPAGDYGVHAAEHKAQKTWNTADLAVSVASGTPWLGHVPIDQPGPVLMFIGEGGEANTVRRIRAIAHERGTTAEHLPIVVCTRAPHLNNTHHMHLFAHQVQTQRPMLVTLDPLYLAAGGANSADLYGMGTLLETPQRVCQDTATALWVVTHFNRKTGSGSARITGAGPAEWGRVIVSASVTSRRTDRDTKATDVITDLDVIGGEIADQRLRLHRRIWADDPNDIDAPLHVTTRVTEPDSGETTGSDDHLSPIAGKILAVLQDAGQHYPVTLKGIGDRLVERHGHGLKRETGSRALSQLSSRDLVDCVETGRFGDEKLWFITDKGAGHVA